MVKVLARDYEAKPSLIDPNVVADGIYACMAQGVNVINIGFGIAVDAPVLRNAVIAASNAGIVLVASVGDTSYANVLYPAKYPEVIAVSGLAQYGYNNFRLAATNARFGFVFARRGIVPEAASSWFLPRLVGISQALEWCYSGKVFDAEEAHRGGLVRSIHEPGQLIDAARGFARGLTADSAPVSIALTRKMMWRMLGADHPMQAHRMDSRAIWSRGAGGDAKEGVSSFLEKRAAVFPDKVNGDMPHFAPWFDEPGYS